MSEEVWGVFFEDQGVSKYLVAVFEELVEAEEAAEARDYESFERALEDYERDYDGEGEGEEPEWEDYIGMHFVEPITRALAEEAQEELELNFAVQVS